MHSFSLCHARWLDRPPQTATGKKSLIKRRARGGDFLEVYFDGRSPMAQTFRKLIWMGGRERFRSRLHVHGNICAEWKIWHQLGLSLDAATGHGLPGTIIFFRGPIWRICQNQTVVGTDSITPAYLAASRSRKSTYTMSPSFIHQS